MSFVRVAKSSLIFAFLIVAIGSQYSYDENRIKNPPPEAPPISLGFVQAVDLGLHSAAAGYYWIDPVIAEAVTLKGGKNGLQKYKNDLRFINTLDPRFSFPYYWTVLILPDENYPDTINAAIEAGTRGVREADSDWRVDFYLATLYHFYKNDKADAAKYFDLAAQQVNAPFYIKRFSENYGIAPNAREQTKQVWEVIARSSDDPELKNRAAAYVARLEMFDFLESAGKIYKQKYGKVPVKIDDLVTGKVLTALPQDPFGFKFFAYPDGTVGIVK